MSWIIFGSFWLITDRAPWYVTAAFIGFALWEHVSDPGLMRHWEITALLRRIAGDK